MCKHTQDDLYRELQVAYEKSGIDSPRKFLNDFGEKWLGKRPSPDEIIRLDPFIYTSFESYFIRVRLEAERQNDLWHEAMDLYEMKYGVGIRWLQDQE